MFNALKYTEKMEEVGFTREQAETSINILLEIMDNKFATKDDLEKLRTQMVNEFEKVHTKMDYGFRDLEQRMTIKLGSMMVITVGVMTAIQKLL